MKQTLIVLIAMLWISCSKQNLSAAAQKRDYFYKVRIVMTDNSFEDSKIVRCGQLPEVRGEDREKDKHHTCLPVTWSYFNVTPHTGYNLVEFGYTCTNTVSRALILRSSDARDWKTAGVVWTFTDKGAFKDFLNQH